MGQQTGRRSAQRCDSAATLNRELLGAVEGLRGCRASQATYMSEPVPEGREYTVLLRSHSGARARLGSYIDINDFPDGLGGQVQVRVSTRWDDIGLGYPVPRELWMAVRTKSQNVDSAVLSAANAASAIATILSFCVNAVVEPPALHVVFNSTEDLSRREFLEVFLPDESGLPRIGRWIDVESLFAFGQAVYASPELPRLFRAMVQYQVALRYWTTGSQVLALAHLYIACEALTKAVQRFHRTRLGLTEEQHAQLLGVDITKTNWRTIAENFARREYIFEGDRTIYKAAREASNQFEHGFADLGNVRQTAGTVTRDLFALVRSAILSLVPAMDQTVSDSIMSKYPVDVSPFYKQVTGYIVSEKPSDPLNLGGPGELFPILKWHSRLKALRLQGDDLIPEPEETFRTHLAPGLKFEIRDFAVFGGLNPPPPNVMVQRLSYWERPGWAIKDAANSHMDVQVGKRDLLAAVMPLVNAAVASGAETSYALPAVLAFNLLGQGVAYFEAARTLIASGQPVEALALLRGLVTIAARFEQMSQDREVRLGLVVRLILDGLDNELSGNAVGHAGTSRDDFLRNALNSGLQVPDHVPLPETTMIWRSLTVEMRLAQYVVDGGIGIVNLHVKPEEEANRVGFHTRVEPGPFTDLISSACVIAQLSLLRYAAPIFGWTTDAETIEAVLTEARELNNMSVRSL